MKKILADICLLADDDMVFSDGYKERAVKSFEDNPNADVIIFNIDEKPVVRYVNKKTVKIKKHNYGRYGAARIAFRREKVFLAGVSFNLMFGGGAKYSAGEDTLFLKSCLDKGLKLVAVPYAIAKLVETRESTWFQGYNDKFFYDKGVLYSCLTHKTPKLFAFIHCIRYRKKYKEYGWKNAYQMMKKAIREHKS